MDLDRVAMPAAEQRVHRHAERLGGEVEQRHVDGRQRERGLEQPPGDPRQQRPPLGRVLADQLRPDPLLDERDDGLLRLGRQLRHGTRLAVADEAVLGDDPHEHVR
jgi:hypothetical protein